MGTRMLRMPNCLLKLTRVVLGHKLRALFILAFKFMSFVSIVLYWRITQDSKGRDQTYLPVQIHCAHSVPSPPCAVADGPSPPPGDVFFCGNLRTNQPKLPVHVLCGVSCPDAPGDKGCGAHERPGKQKCLITQPLGLLIAELLPQRGNSSLGFARAILWDTSSTMVFAGSAALGTLFPTHPV